MKIPWLSSPRHTASRRVAGIFLSFLTAVLTIALLSPAQEPPPIPRESSDSLDGAVIFRQHCATCHGTDARGHGPMSMALKHGAPDLTRISQRNNGKFPAERVRETIEGTKPEGPGHGSREMPVWGPVFHEIEWDRDLGNVRIEAITKYLQTLQQK
ncbi:MAG TPA: c-type cytochrome [Terriglobia bacterium]|nr:c-type cytochrome [Terriglobia bacterium]